MHHNHGFSEVEILTLKNLLKSYSCKTYVGTTLDQVEPTLVKTQISYTITTMIPILTSDVIQRLVMLAAWVGCPKWLSAYSYVVSKVNFGDQLGAN